MSSSSSASRSRVLRGKAASTVRRAAIDDALVPGGTPFSGLDAAAAGIEAAPAERTTELRHAMGALAAAVHALDARQVTALEDIQDQVVAAAFELATALVGRELELSQNPGADALVRAMALA